MWPAVWHVEKQRMRTCLRAILMKIGGIPAAEISKYGISSLRKFLPELGKARRIGTASACGPAYGRS